MIDADFVRIFYNKTSNQFDTEDAFLSKELNCDFVTGGLCADSKVLNSKIVHVLSLRLILILPKFYLVKVNLDKVNF